MLNLTINHLYCIVMAMMTINLLQIIYFELISYNAKALHI